MSVRVYVFDFNCIWLIFSLIQWVRMEIGKACLVNWAVEFGPRNAYVLMIQPAYAIVS